MKKFVLLLIVLSLLVMPVRAMEFTAPAAPEAAEEYLPGESKSFGKDLWSIVRSAIYELQPSLTECIGVCVCLIALMLLVSMVQSLSGKSKYVVELACAVAVGIILFTPANALIKLGVNTVNELIEYGKLLLPVLTSALAAQGGINGSVALYTGTVVFNTILSVCISKAVVPMIYIYIVLAIAGSAVGNDTLKSLQSFVKWLMTWSLKIILYVFTGYMGVTGVVSGTMDAAAIKATKIAINGVVPVVGNIVSDASESILVSAGVMKNSVGIYGLLVFFALWLAPFLQIGMQYILLKATGGICSVFGQKQSVKLIKDFSGAMGLLLAMTGAVCLMLLISTICFMKGAANG